MKHSAPLYLLAGLIPLVLAATVPRIFPEGIKTDTIVGVSGVTPPGMVPVGGMVAVMASTANAWAPPASGQCKDGFARADGVSFSGHASCAGAVITATPPNMIGSYPRGNTTSGGTGGANTQATNVALSAHSVTQPVLSAHSVTQPVLSAHSITQPVLSAHSITQPVLANHTVTQPAYSVPGHYHGIGTGAGLAASLGLSGSAPSLTGTTTFASQTHFHNAGSNLYGYIYVSGGTMRFRYMPTTSWQAEWQLTASSGSGDATAGILEGLEMGGYTAGPSSTSSVGITGGSYSLTGSNNVTGTIGLVTGGSNGNTTFATSRTTDADVSAHSLSTGVGVGNHTLSTNVGVGNHTLSTNVGVGDHTLSTNVGVGNHTVTNNAVNNEPAYVEVVWVIRVK